MVFGEDKGHSGGFHSDIGLLRKFLQVCGLHIYVIAAWLYGLVAWW